jgi:hypothetical protein
MTDHAEDATQDIQTKHDEFHKACKTILPKVDHKLIEDLFRQQEDSEEGTLPLFSIEVITKKGLDTQEMKDHIWGKFGEMPHIDSKGTHYRCELELTLGKLKQISDHDFVLDIKGTYIGPHF